MAIHHLLHSRPINFLLFTILPFLLQNPTRAEDPILNYCDSGRNFTSGSPFQTNLNHLLSSLTTNGPANGFYNTSSGESPDAVYGLVQCRGDTSSEACKNCLNTSSVEIVSRCPNQKEASIRYEDCLLRYSDQRFFSILDLDNTGWEYSWFGDNVSNPDYFNQRLQLLLNNLSSTASSKASRFAVEEVRLSDFQNIYGLMQCTRDLSINDCYSCLQSMVGRVPSCCNKKEGALVVTVSCNIRYSINLFFQASLLPPPSSIDAASTTGDGNDNTKRFVIIIIVVGVAALILVAINCTFFLRKRVRKKIGAGDGGETQSLETLLFDLETLKAATDDFSDANKLGQGGFGPVFKGKLLDGQEIAVKRLAKTSVQGVEELRNEVVLVAKLQHRNLVRLLGCCLEEEKMLVYEYVQNTSLDSFLFDRNKSLLLNWETRYKIVVGIARGLVYLHEDSQIRIIHRDLKASNILLDKDMNPKISDFGLARLFGGDQSHENTSRIAGTYGYMAPEYIIHGQFSAKSDVYSFGVLVLEIVTGRKNAGFRESECDLDLISYTWRYWTEGNPLELVDQTLGGQFERDEALRCIHIGLLCVQRESLVRPTMSSVLLKLNSYSVTLPAPSPPGFFAGRNNSVESGTTPVDSSLQASEADKSRSTFISTSSNQMSITELDAR